MTGEATWVTAAVLLFGGFAIVLLVMVSTRIGTTLRALLNRGACPASPPMAAVAPPWVGPQPDSGQCGQTNCGKIADPYVDIPVFAGYNGPVPVTALELRLYDVAGKLLPFPGEKLLLPASGLYPGGQLTQSLPPVAGAAMATVTFTVPVQNPPPGTPIKRKATQTILFSP